MVVSVTSALLLSKGRSVAGPRLRSRCRAAWRGCCGLGCHGLGRCGTPAEQGEIVFPRSSCLFACNCVVLSNRL